MARTIRLTLAVMALCAVAATALPASLLEDAKEAEQRVASANKVKRAQEVIMFGNQQNRPAELNDDQMATSYFPSAEKRDVESDDEDLFLDHGGTGAPPQTLTTASSRDPDEDSGSGAGAEELSGEIHEPGKSLYELEKGYHYGIGKSGLNKNVENAVLKSELYGYPSGMNEYRYYGGLDDRRRRSVLSRPVKRSNFRPMVPHVLPTQQNGRFKRDLELDPEDVLALLSLWAAANQAGEQRVQPSRLGVNRFGDALTGYDTEETDEDNEVEDSGYPYGGEWQESSYPVNPARYNMVRRAPGYYVPPPALQYGQPQKRSYFSGWRQRTEDEEPGRWGAFEKKKRFMVSRKRQDMSNAQDVYSLAQLLNGPHRDPGVPVYRRLVL